MNKKFLLPITFILIIMSVIIFIMVTYLDSNRGLKDDPVKRYVEMCRETNADAVLVYRDKQVVGEWYSEDYSGTIMAMSLTKSISSVVLGVLEYNGLIEVNNRVGEYIPSWSDGVKGEVTIEHLLTHRSGLLKFNDPSESVGFSKSKNEYVISLQPEVKPGTTHSYSNEGAQLLSPIMDIAAGQSIADYAKEFLFQPLGMSDTYFHQYGPNNDTWTYADLHTTPKDLLKIGQLIINKGIYSGKRYLNEYYVNKSTTIFKGNNNHGYMWYIDRYEDVKVIIAQGYLNTNLYIIPDRDIIIIRMQKPDKGFSGKDESYPYKQNEEKFISDIISDSQKNIVTKDSEHIADENSSREILFYAIKLSRNGNEKKVIELLTPITESFNSDDGLKGLAHLTIALQHLRYKNFENFKYHVLEAERYEDYISEPYFLKSLEDYKEIVIKGAF